MSRVDNTFNKKTPAMAIISRGGGASAHLLPVAVTLPASPFTSGQHSQLFVLVGTLCRRNCGQIFSLSTGDEYETVLTGRWGGRRRLKLVDPAITRRSFAMNSKTNSRFNGGRERLAGFTASEAGGGGRCVGGVGRVGGWRGRGRGYMLS